MLRKSLCALLASSLSLSAPASAWAANLGQGVKVVVAPVSGAAGAAGAAQTSLLFPAGQTLTTLSGTPNLYLPAVSAPATLNSAVMRNASPTGTASVGASVGVSDAKISEQAASKSAASHPSQVQVAPILESADTPGAIVIRSGAQIQGRDERRIRFDGRVPARGVYAEGEGFKALKTRVMQWVGKHWEAPVEVLLSKNDVLLFGEGHSSLSSIDQIAGNAGRLKAAGVRVIGIEGLKTPDQAAVNAYLAGETETVPDVFPSRKPAFARLMKSAKAEGLRVAALGRPLGEVAAEVAGRAAKLSGESPSSFGSDLIAQVDRADATYEYGLNEAVAEGVITGRNGFMAERLKSSLNAGEKAVALVGGAHIEHPANYEFRLWGLNLTDYGSMAAELRARALSAFSLTLTGGLFEKPRAAGDHRALFGPLYRIADEAAKTMRAFLPTSATTGILHLGETTTQGRNKAAGRLVAVDEQPKVTTHGLLYLVPLGATLAAAAFWLWGAVPGALMLFVGALIGSLVSLYFFADFGLRMAKAWWKSSRRFKAASAVFVLALGTGLFFFHAPVFAFAASLPATIYGYLVAAMALAAAALLRWKQKKKGESPNIRGRISGKRLLAGLLIGLTLGTATMAARPWLVPVAHRFLNADSDTSALTYERAPQAYHDALLRHMESSASGRELLDHYRDRSGTIRLPLAFLIGRGDPHYVPMYDAVFLPETIKDAGDWDAFIKKNAETLYHELWHGIQARRGFITSSSQYEREQEAHIRQNLHLYDLWMNDQNALGKGNARTAEFAEFATDVDAYLKSQLATYDVGHVGPDDPFHAWFKKWRAEEYPRIQVNALRLAAERYLYQSDRPWFDRSAKLYLLALEKAQDSGDSSLEQSVRKSLAQAQHDFPKFSIFPQLAQPGQ